MTHECKLLFVCASRGYQLVVQEMRGRAREGYASGHVVMNWKLIRILDASIGILILWYLRCLSRSRPHKKCRQVDTTDRRMLLIKFWGIGNLVMLLPTIKALRATWPDTAIDFLTLESNREALTMTEAVNNIVTIDTNSLVNFMQSWGSSIDILRQNRYDLVIDFEQFARFSALVTYQIGALRSIGFQTHRQHRHHLYSNVVVYDNDIHITRSFYALAEKAGVTIPFSAELQLNSLKMLQERGRLFLANINIAPETAVVIMHIGTSDNFRERRWIPQRYAALAELLTEKYNMKVVMTGLPNEVHLISAVKQQLKSAALVTDLGGQLPFEDYFAIIAGADLVISADTAAVHLASAMNIPVVGLYGPNSPHLYGPWGKNGLAIYAGFNCSPCITNFNSKINTCRHPSGRGACMQALSVNDVFSQIEKTYLAPEAPYRLAGLSADESR